MNYRNGDDFFELKYLQVDPKTNKTSPVRKYKNVGSAILKCTKQIYQNANIMLFPDDNAIKFYLKNGFQEGEKQTLVLENNPSLTNLH